MMAQVVIVSKTHGATKLYPLNITSNVQPSHVFGCTTSTQQETLQHLQSPSGFAFCFLANTIGPDVVLFLQLSDSSLLRVLIQYKQHTANTLSPNNTNAGFRTTSPANFILQRKRKEKLRGSPETSQSELPVYVLLSCHPNPFDPGFSGNSSSEQFFIKNVPLNQEIQKALLDLGPPNPHAGNLGVLRVFCTYPAESSLASLQESLANDLRYPGATVKFAMLVTDDKDQQILETLPRPPAVAVKRPLADRE